MLSALFVSDLHIKSLSDSRAQAFLHWLKSLGPDSVSHLFLVGDIFDLWVGNHRCFSDRYAPLVTEIRRLKLAGVEIHYFEGNHDLHLKSFWQEQIGIVVHTGPDLFQLGPWKVRVEHGDEADPEDKGYLFLRWFLRTPPLHWLAENLPDRWLLSIGIQASDTSRAYTSEIKVAHESKIREKLHHHAESIAQTVEFDFLINGHVHVHDEYGFKVGGREVRAYNLGSWLTPPFRILRLDSKGASWLTAAAPYILSS